MSHEDCRYCDPGTLCSWCVAELMQKSSPAPEPTPIHELLPEELKHQYLNDSTVADIVNLCAMRHIDREETLVYCIKALVAKQDLMMKELTKLSGIRSAILGTKGTGYRIKWEVLEEMCEL